MLRFGRFRVGPVDALVKVASWREAKRSKRAKPGGTNMATTRTFMEWMREVDALVARRTGLSVHDLPDCCFADWYEDDMAPATAARRAIRAGRE